MTSIILLVTSIAILTFLRHQFYSDFLDRESFDVWFHNMEVKYTPEKFKPYPNTLESWNNFTLWKLWDWNFRKMVVFENMS